MTTRIWLLFALFNLQVACSDTSMSGSSTAAQTPSSPAAVATQNSTGTTAAGTAPTVLSNESPAPAAGAASTSAVVAPVTAVAAFPSPNSTPIPSSTTPLTGLWDAQGYTCNSATPQTEVISITQTASQFIGTKVTGDACVPAGYISFQGTINNGVLSLQFNSAEPGEPVQLSAAATPGTYTPTLVQINGNGVSGPQLTLTPHQN